MAQLSGVVDASIADVVVSDIGTLDWWAWDTGIGGYTSKSGGGGLISTVSALGSGVAVNGTGSFGPSAQSWVGGTPTASGSSSGVLYADPSTAGDGGRITVPADTTVRVVTLFLYSFTLTSSVVATLSDGSASPITLTPTGTWNTDGFNCAITYAAGSAGQTLTLDFTGTDSGSSATPCWRCVALALGGAPSLSGPPPSLPPLQPAIRALSPAVLMSIAQSAWVFPPKTATRPWWEEGRDLRQSRPSMPENSRTRRPAQDPPWTGAPKTATRPWFEESRAAVSPPSRQVTTEGWSLKTAVASFVAATWRDFVGASLPPPEPVVRVPDEPWTGKAVSALAKWLVDAPPSSPRMAPPMPRGEAFTVGANPSPTPAIDASPGVSRLPAARRFPDEPWWRPPLVTGFTAAPWADLADVRRPAQVASQGAQEARGAAPLTGLRSWVAELADRVQARIPVPVLTELFMRSPVVSSFVAAPWADLAELRRPAPVPSMGGQESVGLKAFTAARAWVQDLADRANRPSPPPILTELFMRSPVVSSFVAAAWADIFDLPRRPPPPSARVDEPWSARPVTALRSWFEATTLPPAPTLVVRAGEPWGLKTASAAAPASAAAWGDSQAWVRVLPPRSQMSDPLVLAAPSVAVPLSAAPWTNQGPQGPAPRPPLALADVWTSGPLKLSLPTWVGDAIAQRQPVPRRPVDSQVLSAPPVPLKVFLDVVDPGRPRPTPGPTVPSQMFERRPVAFLRSWGWQTDEFFRNIPLNTPRQRLFDVVSIDFMGAIVLINVSPGFSRLRQVNRVVLDPQVNRVVVVDPDGQGVV